MTESSRPLGEPLLIRGRKPAAILAAGGLLLGSAVLGFAGQTANASSHREAPLIAGDPAVDNTDVYAFTSPDNDKMVTFVANWTPFSEPNGGPNFYPWAEDAYYDINIDNDGDAIADIIFRYEFFTEDLRGNDTFLYNNGPVTSLDDENLLFHQYYTLKIINGNNGNEITILDTNDRAESAPSYTGDASMGGEAGYDALRADAIEPLPNEIITGGGTTVATQADDSFFLDLRVFDLLYGGDLSEIGQDSLSCYNVNSIVLNVRKEVVADNQNKNRNPNIGVWSTTSRAPLLDAAGNAVDPITAANEVQVSRLGNPLVNEVVIPTGLKDAFNSISPDVDATIPEVVDRVLNPEVPALIEAIYGITAPPTPRYDLFEVFLTGIVTNDVVDVDGDPATDNPLEIDLNSQALNADANPANFLPSEMLRLNMSIPVTEEPSRLGVVGGDLQGFPNGRRLADDVVDIELLALEGVYDVTDFPNNVPQDRIDAGVAALAGGDAVNENNKAFSDSFPYVALPNTQSVNQCGDDDNGAPVAPPPPDNGGNAPPVGYPVGGVDTGIGGVDEGVLPALTGSAALLLVGAGAGSLLHRRNTIRKTALVNPGGES